MLESVKEAKEELLDYFEENKEELKKAIKNDEIQDIITEIADSDTDVYANYLTNWFSKGQNYRYVEDALEEFGYTPDKGIFDIIRAGQYLKNEELLNEAVKELKKEYGIERLHRKRSLRESHRRAIRGNVTKRGYKEKINRLRKVYLE